MGEKSIKLIEATKFTANAQYAYRLYRGPPKPHVTTFWAQIFYIHYTTFAG